MEHQDRIALYEGVLGVFLARAKERGYITFETQGDTAQYVQFMRHDGGLYGEVGSRQWQEPERPLPPPAVAALAKLGFSGGGAERNYACEVLPDSAAELAALTDELFRTAYQLDDGFEPIVHSLVLNDVTMPRAEPFTRDLVASVLQDRGLQFLRDQDGDVRIDLSVEGIDQPIVMWLLADPEVDTIFQVCSRAEPPPRSWTRDEWLEVCNGWNREHRWPKAMLIDAPDHVHVMTASDIALNAGVTRALLGDYIDRVVAGTLEFWQWVVMPEQPSSATGDDRPGQERA